MSEIAPSHVETLDPLLQEGGAKWSRHRLAAQRKPPWVLAQNDVHSSDVLLSEVLSTMPPPSWWGIPESE